MAAARDSQPSGRRIRARRWAALGTIPGFFVFGLLVMILVREEAAFWVMSGYLVFQLCAFTAWQYSVCPRCGDFFYRPRSWRVVDWGSPFRDTCVHCGFSLRANP
jgi:hypothetical protein